MNKAQAKRLACRLAAGAIDGNLGAGWPFEMQDHEDCEWSEADQMRILFLVHEIARRDGLIKDWTVTSETEGIDKEVNISMDLAQPLNYIKVSFTLEPRCPSTSES